MQKEHENLLKNIPQSGFIKLTSEKPEGLSGADRAALIRRGNAFFNNGEYEKAGRVFLTTGYTDGLIRIGDWYMEHKNYLEAVRMYWIAPAPDKVEQWVAKAAGALGRWINDE